MWPWDLSPLQDHHGGAQGNHPSSMWASITHLVLPDFSGKLYPSQISLVGVGGLLHQPEKGKTVLFKFKILIKVNFKIQVTK
jgi:hypothetical protein